MGDWHCFKCKQKMEESEVYLSYMGSEFPGILGIKCRQCGVEYLSEEFVIGQLREGEQMMESK